MNNILAENLLRFGVKNLKESDKQKLMEQTGPAVYDFGRKQGANGGFAVVSNPKVAYYQYTPVPKSGKKVSIYSITMAVIDTEAAATNPNVKPVNKTFYFVNGGTPGMDNGVWRLKIAEVYERAADALNESDPLRFTFGGNGAVAKAIQSYKGPKGDVATKNVYGALAPNSMDWKALFNSVQPEVAQKYTLK
jgi:hypothetical protein